MSYTSEFYAALRRMQKDTNSAAEKEPAISKPPADEGGGAAQAVTEGEKTPSINPSDYTSRLYAALKKAQTPSPTQDPITAARDEAQKAQQAVDAYKKNPDPVAPLSPELYFDPFASIGASLGNLLRTGNLRGDEKQAELQAVADAAKAKADHLANEQVASKDRVFLAAMSEEDRKALELYASLENNNLLGLVANAFPGTSSSKTLLAANALQKLMDKGYTVQQVKELAETWSRDSNAKNAQMLADQGKQNASLLDALLTIPLSVVGGATGATDQTLELIKHAVGKDTGRYANLDPNLPGTILNSYSDALREEEGKNVAGWASAAVEAQGGSEKAQEVAGTVAQTVYSAGLSAVENLAKVATLGAAGSLALSGTSAYSRAMREASQKGASPAQAFGMGVFTGAIEVLTEKLPLDNLMGQIRAVASGGATGVKNMLKGLLTQSLQEVTEEELNFLADIFLQAVILDEKSDASRHISQLMESGMSYADAKAQLDRDRWQQALSTAVQAALSGVISSGAVQILGAAGTPISTPTVEQDTTPTDAPATPQPVDPTDYASRLYAELNRLTSDSQTENRVQDAQPLTPTQTAPTAPQSGEGAEQAVDTNAVSKPLSSYPVERQNIIKSYIQSVDENIKGFVQRVKSGDLTFKRQKISDVSKRAASDIGQLLGIDVSGYTHNINTNGIQHILNRHGENGQQDRTMSADADIARVGWVLENYDSVELLTKDGQQVYSREFLDKQHENAPQIRFVKKIDGSYYVVEAAFENDYKKLWVQSAYLQKKEDVTQSPAAGNDTNRETNAQSEIASPSSNNSIPETPPVVNPHESVGAADHNFTGKAAYQDLLTDENTQRDRPGDVRPMEVPKVDGYGRHVSEFVGNAYGAKITSDEMASHIESLVQEGALGFDRVKNKTTFDQAAEEIKVNGLSDSFHSVNRAAFSGKAKDIDVAKAMLLYNYYVNKKNPTQAQLERAEELMVDLSTMANEAGRRLQLFGMMRKLTPEGQLSVVRQSVQRTLDRINKGRGENNQTQAQIPQELEQAYVDAAREDSYSHTEETARAKAKAEAEIYKAVAAQIKASPAEKLKAWRYMAMLGNVKTQIRNVFGNAAFRPLVDIKRVVGAAIEGLTLEQKDRTKAILGFGKDAQDLIAWAGEDAKGATAQELMSFCGQTGDNARTAIDDARQIFDTKWLEAVREFVQAVPEKADGLFKAREYTLSLASFLKARGYTAQDVRDGKVGNDVLSEGRAYAAQEALKATFNDHNTLSDFLSRLRYDGDDKTLRALNILAEGVMPFRRTPANIVARISDYSVVGLFRGIGNAAFNVRSGKVSAATAIDQIAGGLTGMGAMALGWALASGIFGIRLRGKVKEEEELTGHQSYALEIGDKSYDISWLAPSNVPLLVGANLHEFHSRDNDSNNPFVNLANATVLSLEPLLELSCLSSLNDVLETAKYAETGTEVYSVLASAATSYLTQFIPTLLGQVEQATEPKKTSAYSNANTALERSMEKAVGRISQKIPLGDLHQAEKVDQWGRTQESQNAADRVIGAFVNPSRVSQIQETAADKELLRLSKAVPDVNVYPRDHRKEISWTDKEGNAHTQSLTAEQYVTLAKAQGKQSRELVEQITAMVDYKGLTDQQKAKVIKRIYDYTAEVSKSSVVDYDGEPAYIRDRAEGMSIAEAIIRQEVVGSTSKYADLPLDRAAYISELLRQITPEKEGGSVRAVQKVEAVAGSDLSNEQQKDIMDDVLDDAAYEKYEKILAAGFDNDQYALFLRLYQDTEKNETVGKKELTIRAIMQKGNVTRSVANRLYNIYAGQDEKKTEKSDKPLSSFLGK